MAGVGAPWPAMGSSQERGREGGEGRGEGGVAWGGVGRGKAVVACSLLYVRRKQEGGRRKREEKKRKEKKRGKKEKIYEIFFQTRKF
jgi:hypothetical protein